ncbi:MAG: YkvA family protein [Lysobacteraceae bacterium]
MTVSLSIELSDQDLEFFTNAAENAKKTAADRKPEDIIASAGKLLTDANKIKVPDFIAQRLSKLDAMIAMVSDEGWGLPDEDRNRVLSALVYFADPSDVIPDHVPVLGFLDDAIMIELCVRELKHELDAYDDFCYFREREAIKRGVNPAEVGRAEWLDDRREDLFDHMHKRRERDFGVGYGRSSGYGSSKSYSGPWRPSMFRLG